MESQTALLKRTPARLHFSQLKLWAISTRFWKLCRIRFLSKGSNIYITTFPPFSVFDQELIPIKTKTRLESTWADFLFSRHVVFLIPFCFPSQKTHYLKWLAKFGTNIHKALNELFPTPRSSFSVAENTLILSLCFKTNRKGCQLRLPRW